MVKASGLLNIKKKSESLKKDIILYSSTFDYEKFEISDLKNELIKSEEKIFLNLDRIGKATFEIAEELYEVNKKLANHKGGTYMAWCEAVGINKDKSSVLLKKYNLFLETNRKNIMELPIPIVKTLTSKKNNFTTDEMLTIIDSEKPTAKLKEIENQYSQVANTKSCEITEAEIMKGKIEIKNLNKEDLLAKKEELFQENEVLNKEVEKLNKEIESLNRKVKKKLELVKQNKNKINDLDENLTPEEKQLKDVYINI